VRHDFVSAALLPARAPLVQHLFVVFILHVLLYETKSKIDEVLSPAISQFDITDALPMGSTLADQRRRRMHVLTLGKDDDETEVAKFSASCLARVTSRLP
jgi:hypothetical protein